MMAHGCASVKSGVEKVDRRRQEVIECHDLKMSVKEEFQEVGPNLQRCHLLLNHG